MSGAVTSATGAAHPSLQTQRYDEPQILLVLAGLPGSGKSTFAHALVQSAGQRRWTRASQDDSRSKRRQEVEDTVRAALARGDNVVVDRVNFNPEQRAHFIRIASEAWPRPQICCLVLTVSEGTIRARLAARTDHPTLTSADMAIDVLGHMKRQWVLPSYEEGFDRILVLRENEQPPIWDVMAAQSVLKRIERQQQRTRGNRGRGRGGYARGGMRGQAPRDQTTRGANRGHVASWHAHHTRGSAQDKPWKGRQYQAGFDQPRPLGAQAVDRAAPPTYAMRQGIERAWGSSPSDRVLGHPRTS